MKIFQTLLFRFVNKLSRAQKKIFLALIDIILAPIAFLVASSVFYDALPSIEFLRHSIGLIVVLAGIAGAISILLKMPNIKLNAYESRGILRTGAMAVLVTLTFSMIIGMSNLYFSRLGIVLFGMIFFLMAVS
ncbi:MAG: polysaccharide biosynthesis protein, partial [Pseudorhodobacter sp.]|nr:polysaccharide biosynthesis protein [Pseudorhodobacter sp.]